MKKIGIIIPAGGVGTRMAVPEAIADSPATLKQFMLLAGRPVLAHAIEAFRCVAKFSQIVIALPDDRMAEWERLRTEHRVLSHTVCAGGATRFLSVRNAIAALDVDYEYIAVHDAARPLVSSGTIFRAIKVARAHGSAIPVVPLVDSVRRVKEGASWAEGRGALRGVQTPQVFRADILCTGYNRAVGDNFADDAAVVESVGYTVALCEGERRNFKITEPEDLVMAEALLARCEVY
ncbi:MAG: 2-C-methyl-D-erythritol 4-phosphate cytidylyltransferase [Alistipes sp.]|jgi:2-C-methyl-D-erythritol 4-phosphate cytidylyltransferase|nr:2-C-methyl-D-erythritol 4-phosphate cytidylyltransferase [Alistipes sp.]